jgi:uncharacterized membrane protein
MVNHLTTVGAVHAILAMAGIVIGLVQLLQAKGSRMHRALGYAYVYGMLVADGTALLIYQFTGRFNILHVGAVANLICVIAAMVPVLRNPRPVDWKARHYRWISGSYLGLIAAAATELVVRTLPFSTRGQAWIATAGVATAATVVGAILIHRYRHLAEPNLAPRAPPEAAMTADIS